MYNWPFSLLHIDNIVHQHLQRKLISEYKLLPIFPSKSKSINTIENYSNKPEGTKINANDIYIKSLEMVAEHVN